MHSGNGRVEDLEAINEAFQPSRLEAWVNGWIVLKRRGFDRAPTRVPVDPPYTLFKSVGVSMQVHVQHEVRELQVPPFLSGAVADGSLTVGAGQVAVVRVDAQ